MNAPPARSRPRCLVALGLTLALVLILVAGLVIPWRERDQFYDEAIETHGGQLQRYLSIIATLPELNERLQAVRANREIRAYYLEATDPSLAGVELQRYIQDFVRASGGTLASAQILPVEDDGGTPRVGVRLRLRAFPDDLHRLFHRIETSKPLLFITRLSVQAPRRNQRPSRSNPGDMLNLNLDVFAYMRKDLG